MATKQADLPGTSGEGTVRRGSIAGTGGDAMRGVERIGRSGNELGMRMLDQAEENTREAFRAMREAAQARDLSEVIRIQKDYLREQRTRSMSQARDIGEMIAGFGRSALDGFADKDDV